MTLSTAPTTSSQPTEVPFYEEAAFIVGMVVLGVILVFLLCTIFLCCVRPRNGDKKGLQVSRSFQVELDHSPSKNEYSKLSEPSPKRAPVTGSWSPGDPYTVSVDLMWQTYGDPAIKMG